MGGVILLTDETHQKHYLQIDLEEAAKKDDTELLDYVRDALAHAMPVIKQLRIGREKPSRLRGMLGGLSNNDIDKELNAMRDEWERDI